LALALAETRGQFVFSEDGLKSCCKAKEDYFFWCPFFPAAIPENDLNFLIVYVRICGIFWSEKWDHFVCGFILEFVKSNS
jgi:hypothetical protein